MAGIFLFGSSGAVEVSSLLIRLPSKPVLASLLAWRCASRLPWGWSPLPCSVRFFSSASAMALSRSLLLKKVPGMPSTDWVVSGFHRSSAWLMQEYQVQSSFAASASPRMRTTALLSMPL